MSANTTPIYTGTIRRESVSIATANTNRDGTGTLGLLITGGTNGTILETIIIKASVTTTAGMIRFFLYNGTDYFLFKEVNVTALTPSATVQGFVDTTNFAYGFYLKSTDSIYVSTHNAETFKITAFGGDF